MCFHTIIVKTTMGCNLNCNYCYAKTESQRTMNIYTMKKMIEEAARLDVNTLNFIWHGGEPLLLNKDFYETAVQHQRYIYDLLGIRCTNKIQTNGTLISNRYAEFLSENNFEVGISLDGPKELHDIHRLDRFGESSYEKAVEGYYNLRKYEADVGILCVVSPISLKRTQDFIEWLVELECDSISFNWRFELKEILLDSNWASLYAEFLLKIEEKCRSLGLQVNIRELIQARNVATSNKHSSIKLCNNLEPCLYTHSAVTPNGDIYMGCDRFIYDEYSISKKFILGNVFDNGFISALRNSTFEKYESYFFEGKKNCKRNCPEFDSCPGICLADWFSKNFEKNSEFIPHINRCTAAIIPKYINMEGNNIAKEKS